MTRERMGTVQLWKSRLEAVAKQWRKCWYCRALNSADVDTEYGYREKHRVIMRIHYEVVL
jgi:hypothetical protein